MPSVSLLACNLASNALGRVHLLAKMLQSRYEVHIVGPGSVEGLWPPLRDDRSVEFRGFPLDSAISLWRFHKRIATELITGDVVFACKPLLPSYGLGLLARQLRSRPLLLDIDDWELGFIGGARESLYWEVRMSRLKWITGAYSPLYTRLLDRHTDRADAITVSNRFLQQRYGGLWIPHARDEAHFQLTPEKISDRPVVLFLGTPRPNKGVDLLLQAWQAVKHRTARLRIIGASADLPLASAADETSFSRIELVPGIPFADMPAAIREANVIVIPQRQVRGSSGQLPAKLIDAMAGGRAIISTSVGDIPYWLQGGAGCVIPPDDVGALARAIDDLLESPDSRAQMGRRAHDRFMSEASFCAVRPLLCGLIEDALRAGK